jgi:hypothetical protein
MKKFKDFITEALPPHLSKFIKDTGDIVTDRTPSFKPDKSFSVSREDYKKAEKILRKKKIVFSTKGYPVGNSPIIYNIDKDNYTTAIKELKKNGIKIINTFD